MKKKKKSRKVKKKLKKIKKKPVTRKKKKLKKRCKNRKKAKSIKGFLKRLDREGLLGAIKPRLKFNFSGFLKKLTSPFTDKINNYKRSRERLKLKQKQEIEKEQKLQSSLRTQLLKKEIKEEQALAKTRSAELKSFLKSEQKTIREKEKEKQRKFLEEVKLEKTLERFRARELEEIKAIEKYTLNIEKEDYKAFQQRIEEVREKYRDLRNKRLRERVLELGVQLSDQASVEETRRLEKEYIERRELISVSLESFRRSATSLIYQISKRYLPKNADLLRVVDRVYEESEIIIKEDQAPLSEYLVLIYLKDQDFKKGVIVVEDKITQSIREYDKIQIFKFGDELTDSMIRYLEKLREGIKKAS